MLEKGLVQIYTGDGKGKTTAAFGLALRAAGAGNNVLIWQFLKSKSLDIAERKALENLQKRIKLRCINMDWKMGASLKDNETVNQMRSIISGILDQIAGQAKNRTYDVIILDEIVFCLSKKLAKFEDVKAIIENKHPKVEIVLTGRGADKKLIDIADLVTEMKKIKHPFDQNIPARRGIEY
jgi:cob(I)alamin adenosyltransferase